MDGRSDEIARIKKTIKDDAFGQIIWKLAPLFSKEENRETQNSTYTKTCV